MLLCIAQALKMKQFTILERAPAAAGLLNTIPSCVFRTIYEGVWHYFPNSATNFFLFYYPLPPPTRLFSLGTIHRTAERSKNLPMTYRDAGQEFLCQKEKKIFDVYSIYIQYVLYYTVCSNMVAGVAECPEPMFNVH